MTTIRYASALVLCAALAGCSTNAGPSAITEPTSSSPAATATPSPATVALGTDLADGQHHARVTAYDPDGPTVTVDVVQFFVGQAAIDAAVEDGYDAGDVANDHYTRNENKRLRTLTVDAEVRIVVNTLSGDRTGDAAEDTVVTSADLAGYVAAGAAQHALFELTLEGGVVVALEEQYLP